MSALTVRGVRCYRKTCPDWIAFLANRTGGVAYTADPRRGQDEVAATGAPLEFGRFWRTAGVSRLVATPSGDRPASAGWWQRLSSRLTPAVRQFCPLALSTWTRFF